MVFLIDVMRQFMGWDLSKRDLTFHYSLAAVRNTAKPVLSHLFQLEKLRKNSDHDKEMLRQLLFKVRQLNRCSLGVRHRLALNEHIVGLFYAPAMGLFAQYSKDGGVPDSEDRQQTLDGMIEICHALMNSYKSVVGKLYAASTFRYAHSLNEFDVSCFRILDLLRLKQRIKGIRYQELSDVAWQTANSIIYMMLEADRADKQMVLMAGKYIKSSEVKTMRMRDLYSELQISHRFQLLKWPVQWQMLLDCSIGLGDFKLTFSKDEEQSQGLLKYQTISYFDDCIATRAQRRHDQSIPGLLLNWDKLHQKITSDFAQVLRAQKNTDPAQITKHLTLLSAPERLALAQLQSDTFFQKKEEISDIFQRLPDLRIFVGFSEVFHLLAHIASDGGWQKVGQRMSDLLARHSSALSEDDIGTVESAWFIHFHHATSLRLGTQETRYTKNMKIGEITAYVMTPEDIRRPCLGVITRISRPQAGSILIDIEKTSSHAESVWVNKTSIQNDAQFDKENAFPGIIGRDGVNGMSLFLANIYRVAEGSILLIEQNSIISKVVVGNIISVTKGFTLTAVRLISQDISVFAGQEVIN